MDLRAVQKPLKEGYRSDPSRAFITLRACGDQGADAMACSVDLGRAIQEAEAHAGVGGPGAGACSGDLLLGALAACTQITCQMVAAAMGVPVERIAVEVEGDLDLRGTLGVDREAPVGFAAIRVAVTVDAPDADPQDLAALRTRVERYCVVMQTLTSPPAVAVDWRTPEVA
jgi:uncharacterized OsmC-like protein